MRTRSASLFLLFSLLLFSARGCTVHAAVVMADPDVGAVVEGNNRFAFEVYGRLAEQRDGNLLISPYSISTALAMTYAGARGQTEREMADVLHFTLPQQQLHAAFGSIIAGLSNRANLSGSSAEEDEGGAPPGNHPITMDELQGGIQPGFYDLPPIVGEPVFYPYFPVPIIRPPYFPAPPSEFPPPGGAFPPRIGYPVPNPPERSTTVRSFELSVANRLWGQQGYSFRSEFLDTTRENYGAELAELDFRNEREQARETINDWVSDQTKQRINGLIPKGAIRETTRLVLTNAIYFQASWKNQFDQNATTETPFKLTANTETAVPMMRQTSSFRYGDFPQCQLLEMPYSDGNLSMLAVLPKEIDGLAELEQWLTADTFDEYIDELRSQEVSVFLPKFKMTNTVPLRELLISMGMSTAFSDQADFSGITELEPLHIESIGHKAFIEWDEEGAEAAAATFIGGGWTTSVYVPPPVFRADHPFAYFIRDNETGSILFMGRVMDPGGGPVTAVPEPGTLTLAGFALLALALYGWRRRAAGRDFSPGRADSSL